MCKCPVCGELMREEIKMYTTAYPIDDERANVCLYCPKANCFTLEEDTRMDEANATLNRFKDWVEILWAKR